MRLLKLSVFWLNIPLVFSVILFSGCNGAKGLHSLMNDHDFTYITPPQTNWEVGAIVIIEPSFQNSPVVRVTPSVAGAPIIIYPSDTPNIENNHNSKLDLSLGISLPANLKVSLAANKVSQYSIVSNGNKIKRVYLDPYAANTFPVMEEKYSRYWQEALTDKKLFYLYELWFADELVYKFLDENGLGITAPIPIQIPLDLSANWKWKKDGSLVYKGSTPICIGYKGRRIRISDEGIQPTAPIPIKATTQIPEATVDLYE